MEGGSEGVVGGELLFGDVLWAGRLGYLLDSNVYSIIGEEWGAIKCAGGREASCQLGEGIGCDAASGGYVMAFNVLHVARPRETFGVCVSTRRLLLKETPKVFTSTGDTRIAYVALVHEPARCFRKASVRSQARLAAAGS